ncbi:MAG: hypothetical protein AAFY76_06850 [Cyanobacteria bacterium J06649_11]
MAELLQVDQGNISGLEQRTDLMISTTLQKYIAAMAGDLKLVVEFPNRSPVTKGRYFRN